MSIAPSILLGLLHAPIGHRRPAALASWAQYPRFLSGLVIGLGALAGCSESSLGSSQPQGPASDETEMVGNLNGTNAESNATGEGSALANSTGQGGSSPSSSGVTEGRSGASTPLVPSGENAGSAPANQASGGTDAGVQLTADAASVAPQPVTVFVAGDSIVSNYPDTDSPIDQAGWGQMLPKMLDGNVTVVNRARGGRTALWFSLEGELDRLLDAALPGDYLLVQFGTNDSHRTAEFTVNGQTRLRYADPNTDFKQQLTELYIEPAKQRGVQIVLVTPPPRNSAYCTGGNSLGRWAQAMRELGEEQEVPVADMNTRMVDYLQAICPAPTPENIYFLRPDGSVDGTHFQEEGARRMALFILDELAQEGIGLANSLTEAGRL